MTQRAQLVLDLVERMRGAKGALDPRQTWEWTQTDSKRGIAQETSLTGQNPSPTAQPRALTNSGSYVYDDLDPEARSEAERDMQTIRSKRSAAAAVAAANANANSGGGGQVSGGSGPGGDKQTKKSRKRGVSALTGLSTQVGCS